MLLEYHRALLADEVRTNAYRDAIRAAVKPGDVVLDLGSGSGILALFACEAGARRVYAIEQSASAGVAAFLARHLGFSDRITVIRKHSSEVELPDKADVLVTETLGAFGLDEQIASSVIDARTRLLRPGAAIIPGDVRLFLAAVELPESYARRVEWWKRPRYGFDLAPLRVFASNVAYIDNVPAEALASDAAAIVSVNMLTISSPEISGSATLTATRAATIHGFAGWFSAALGAGIELTNRERGATHWGHVFLPLETPLELAAGATIAVELSTADGKSWRWRGDGFDQMTPLATPPFA